MERQAKVTRGELKVKSEIGGAKEEKMYRGGHIWASMDTCTCKHGPIIPGGLCYTNTDTGPPLRDKSV